MRAVRLLLALTLTWTVMAYAADKAPPPRMQLGVDADDWSNQVRGPAFESALRQMQIDFISWHIQPEEEMHPEHLQEIVDFCHRNHWGYLFNTEVGNYRRHEPLFQHADGTYRYDLLTSTLERLAKDPLFLGVVYDEGDLVQAMLGMPDGKGGTVEPYLANTRTMSAEASYFAVQEATSRLVSRYAKYGKRVIFEMTFPDYPFAFTRGGALVAPKLLKENFNDLMYADYRGAALEYHSRELWACIDLWFLDKFPTGGQFAPGDHTPQQLLASLEYANNAGIDYAYIEQVKALVDDTFALTDYGRQVVAFQQWRKQHAFGNWRTAKIDYVVKRFPDGYWGQAESTFIPDHPYGSWVANPFHAADGKWFGTLNQLSNGVIPVDADTWNAQRSSFFSTHPYRTEAGLPPMIVVDPFGSYTPPAGAKLVDLTR